MTITSSYPIAPYNMVLKLSLRDIIVSVCFHSIRLLALLTELLNGSTREASSQCWALLYDSM